MTDQVSVRGVRELARSLRQFEGGVADLRDANEKVGKIVAEDAKRRVPRRSGKLAGTIRATRAPHRVKIGAGGARAVYGPVIHWGWPARHIRRSAFLTEAAAATRPQWIDAYTADIDRLTRKVQGA